MRLWGALPGLGNKGYLLPGSPFIKFCYGPRALSCWPTLHLQLCPCLSIPRLKASWQMWQVHTHTHTPLKVQCSHCSCPIELNRQHTVMGLEMWQSQASFSNNMPIYLLILFHLCCLWCISRENICSDWDYMAWILFAMYTGTRSTSNNPPAGAPSFSFENQSFRINHLWPH